MGTSDLVHRGPSIRNVVDAIGVGLAQLRVLGLAAGGVNFCDGVELILGNAMVLSISRDFDLGRNQRALLSTMTLTGLMLGNFASGYVGDALGRRKPIVGCFAVTVIMGFVCAAMPTFSCVLLIRTFLGIGMGLGISPASAMISETTPEPWRIMFRVATSSCFALGGLFVSLLAALDDPSYQNLQWRHLMIIAAIPPVVWSVLAALFLPESPVWLAAVDEHTLAKKGFQEMAQLNSAPDVDVDYAEPHRTDSEKPTAHRKHEQLTLQQQLRMVFSKRLWYSTFATFSAAFCINLVAYGDGYAAPQVLSQAATLAPAWQCVIKACISILWVLIAGLFAEVFSRKFMMFLATAFSSSVCFAFAIAGSHPAPRPVFLQMLFQYGANGSPVGAALGYVVIFQVSVEIYPTAASATGGALITGGSRLAALAAPLIFENLQLLTHEWTPFYYFMGSSCAVAAVLVSLMRPIKAYRPGEEEEEEAALAAGCNMVFEDASPSYGTIKGQ